MSKYKSKSTNKKRIENFHFKPGTLIAGKYKIIKLLGEGWEGEVYKIQETNTKIVRAAKFFFPHRNKKNKVAARYAKLLHTLSDCPIVIHYYAHEIIPYQGHNVTCLISEYVDGEILTSFLKRQPGKRIGVFRALHFLHSLITGLETMHANKLYHGDLHAENVIIKRYGLGFDLKLLDMYDWGQKEKRLNIETDIIDSIRLFYDAIGGRKHYAKQPPEIKQICMGLRRDLILKKFKSARDLRLYLENINWQSPYRE